MKLFNSCLLAPFLMASFYCSAGSDLRCYELTEENVKMCIQTDFNTEVDFVRAGISIADLDSKTMMFKSDAFVLAGNDPCISCNSNRFHFVARETKEHSIRIRSQLALIQFSPIVFDGTINQGTNLETGTVRIGNEVYRYQRQLQESKKIEDDVKRKKKGGYPSI